MSFVGSLFGGSGGAQSAEITKAVSKDEAIAARKRSDEALQQQQQFLQGLQGQGGLANQTNVFNQQQALANQLQGVAQGNGPNPALAQLAQTTGQNIASQNALMAGQRGASANPGMIARQAAMQGGNMNQQAAGQAATLRAQQQLSGIQALQNQQAMLGNMANTQVGELAAGTGAYTSGTQAEQQQLLNAISGQNNAEVQNASQYNQAVGQRQQMGMKLLGGGLNALGGGMGALLGGGGSTGAQAAEGTKAGMDTNWGQYLGARGGEVPSSNVGKHLYMYKGGMSMKQGGHVPGQAKVGGDSLKNDNVKALLSPGEIVLPRSVAQHPNAPDMAAKFVAAIKSKKMRA